MYFATSRALYEFLQEIGDNTEFIEQIEIVNLALVVELKDPPSAQELHWSQDYYDLRVGSIHKRQVENTAMFKTLACARNLKSIELGYEIEAEDMRGTVLPKQDVNVDYYSPKYWSRRMCEKELADPLFPTLRVCLKLVKEQNRDWKELIKICQYREEEWNCIYFPHYDEEVTAHFHWEKLVEQINKLMEKEEGNHGTDIAEEAAAKEV